MHPLFAAVAVFLFALALAGGFTLAAAAAGGALRSRRRRDPQLAGWMDFDGSARRAVRRRPPLGV